MRFAAAALMLVAATARGAGHAHRLSLILSDPVHNEHTATGTTWSGELALEYSYGITPRLSIDARAGFERRLDYFYSLDRPTHPPGNTRELYWERRAVTRPWTLLATFRGDERGRFTPRISAGLRHVRAPIVWYRARSARVPDNLEIRQGWDYDDRNSPQVIAGGDFRLTGRFALRGDVGRLIRDNKTPYDPRTTAALGLIWRMR